MLPAWYCGVGRGTQGMSKDEGRLATCGTRVAEGCGAAVRGQGADDVSGATLWWLA